MSCPKCKSIEEYIDIDFDKAERRLQHEYYYNKCGFWGKVFSSDRPDRLRGYKCTKCDWSNLETASFSFGGF